MSSALILVSIWYGMPGTVPTADFGLLSKAVAGAEKLELSRSVGNIWQATCSIP